MSSLLCAVFLKSCYCVVVVVVVVLLLLKLSSSQNVHYNNITPVTFAFVQVKPFWSDQGKQKIQL